ncbi:MAG: hypothetical protein B9S32_09410 [Verrucomicrobia bacterium Tous-C9LFEB]|nr:MAG: hypothetical protein B9S32_09410 [Verrucomicrobia bacterium Tous-C9LFEB]
MQDQPFQRLLQNPSFFSRWVDPKTKVESYILNQHVAPVQQSFYYTNPSLTRDGNYYWFYCSFPPSGDARLGRTLAVLDVRAQEIRYCPETQFSEASPLVDVESGEVYWCSGAVIWKRKPEKTAMPEKVNELPAEIVQHRRVAHVATHLTFSATKKRLNFDSRIGEDWYIGSVPLDGSVGSTWQKLDRCYNHAQFSPTDEHLQLFAQDFYANSLTGKVTRYENRMWLIREGEKAVPVFSDEWARQYHGYRGTTFNAHTPQAGALQVSDPRAMHGHEWWAADGTGIYYVHYGQGVERVSLADRKPVMIWPLKTISHAHATMQGDYLVGDNQPQQDLADSRVVFFNPKSGREINIVSDLPRVPAELKSYHLDPHPQFCLGDQMICYTTTILGRMDVAFTPVDALIEATR